MKGTEMDSRVYLALGSNLGDRERNLLAAIKELDETSGIKVLQRSSIYETEPVGYLEQDRFLNMVIAVTTDREPLELLKILQNIERDLKRTREIHWGPRTIDIDILLFNDIEMNTPELIIPHPRMYERAFVLIPLKDILKSGKLGDKPITSLINECHDKNGVKIYKTGNIDT